MPRESRQKIADPMGGNWIDQVPPGTGDDHFFIQRQGLQGLKYPVFRQLAQLDGAMPFFPGPGAAPQGQDGIPPTIESLQRVLPERGSAYLAQWNGLNTIHWHG